MKSVSFSDLSKYSDFQMSETDSNTDLDKSKKQFICNGGGKNKKYDVTIGSKTLTHYNSSEDILKKFSSNSFDRYRNNSADCKRDYNDCNGDIKHTLEPSMEPTYKIPSNYDKDTFIKELKEQLNLKDKTITKLQEELNQEKNRYERLKENCKIQESRIQYLEHMVSAFTVDKSNTNETNNLQQNKSFMNGEEKENHIDIYKGNNSIYQQNGVESNENNSSHLSYQDSRIIESSVPVSNNYSQQQQQQSYKQQYRMSTNNSNNINLKYRPTSADSINLSKTYSSPSNKRWNDTVTFSNSHYMNKSDSEDFDNGNLDRHNEILDSKEEYVRQGSPTKDLISRQKQKLDRERSVNLSEFKNKLDEFARIAQKTTEKNSLPTSSNPHDTYGQYKKDHHDNQPTSSYIQRSNQQTSSYNHGNQSLSFNKGSQQQSPSYHHGYTQTSIKSSPYINDRRTTSPDTRPPLNPHHKVSINKSYSSAKKTTSTDSYPILHTTNEDEKLKERVKQILDKNNYYSSTSSQQQNNNGYQPPSSPIKQMYHHDRNYTLPSSSSSYYHNIDESNVPKLDLTKNYGYNSDLDPETSDLVGKYLNYSAYE